MATPSPQCGYGDELIVDIYVYVYINVRAYVMQAPLLHAGAAAAPWW
jgi:hypothetical protein